MTEPRRRPEKVAIIFMIAWLIFWAAGMLIVLAGLVSAISAGQTAPIVFMLIWLAFAGIGLYAGAIRLRRLLLRETPVRRPPLDRAWHDGMTERPKK